MEMPDVFVKIVAVVENMLQSSILSTRLLAVRVLADFSSKILGRTSFIEGRNGSNLACQFVSFVLDRIIFLLTLHVDVQPVSSEVEVKSLLNLLFILVDKHSHLCCLVLRKMCVFIDKLMKMLDRIMDTMPPSLSNPELIKSVVIYVSKMLVVCLENIEETDAETYKVLDAMKLQAEHVCQSRYFDDPTRMCYFFLLHLHATYNRLRHMAENLVPVSGNMSLLFVDSVLQIDKFIIDCANKLLGETSYWSSYKVGKIAACRGAWSTAAFIFEQLVKEAKSVSCVCWLKSLAQFSTSENEIQVVVLSYQCTSGCPEINLAERENAAVKINQDCMNKLLRAHDTLLSSATLLSTSDMGNLFSFQTWFLTLRAKVMKTVVDIMNILDTVSHIRDSPMLSGVEKSILLPCVASFDKYDSLIHTCSEVSNRMKKLAQEFDLLLMSFMSIDKQSVMILSALGWSCSLMAFTTGYAFLVSNMHSSENFGNLKYENSEEPFHASLVEDLAGRLNYTDSDAKRNLLFLLKSRHNYKGHSVKLVRTQISSTCFESGILQRLCEYSIRRIAALQKESSKVLQDGDAQFQIVTYGSELLFYVISKCLSTCFRTPGHFFQVRPPVSSELLVMNEDGKYLDGTSILSGCHLSLNLCFQLKNMPSNLSAQVTKAHCILHCKIQTQIQSETGESSGQSHLSSRDHEINDMVDLNQKLLTRVIGSDVKSSRGRPDECCMVNEYLCFQLNERGQGFSTCLLDVSAFPVGSYRIKWHSGFIDNEGSYHSLLPLKAGPFCTFHIIATI